MRIGILTFHEVFNPGAFWQAYASCQLVRKLGHEPIIINYTHPAHRFRPFKRLFTRSALRYPRNWLDNCRKNAVYEHSRRELLPLSRRIVSHEDLFAEYFDAVLIGADIVWDFRDQRLGRDSVYFGGGLNTSRLISWAASMGSCRSDGDIPQFVIEGFLKFKALSVRDESTKSFVRRISGRDAVILPDPAFSLDIQEAPLGTAPQKPYIAVYTSPALVSPLFIKQARAFADSKKLPLQAVGYRTRWADSNFINAAPEDWLATLQQAEYVITNTFHGTVFSILFGKQFLTEYNPAMISKTKGMMEMLGLESRVFDSGNSIKNILSTGWNRAAVRGRISELAAEASLFLEQELSD